MRRTARALSLAAVTGTVLGALAPAAFAGTVTAGGPSWSTASASPCPEPEEHGWEGSASRSTPPDVARPEGFEPGTPAPEGLEPETLGQEALEDEALEPEAVAPVGTALDELVPDAVPEGGAQIPAPAGTGAAESKAKEPWAGDLKPTASKTVEPKPVEPEPVEPKPVGPRPTGSAHSPCPSAPAHQGVHAGGGGAFTDSVPALAAGGLLIAGAFGAAAHRLYRDRTAGTDV